MTGKNKSELQIENLALKKELDEWRINYEKKLEESTSNSKCSKCDNTFANVGDVTKPQDKQYSVSQTIKCDICEKVFDVKLKMTVRRVSVKCLGKLLNMRN